MSTHDIEEEGSLDDKSKASASVETSPAELKKEGEAIFGAEETLKIEELFGQVESLKKALAEKNPDAAIAINKKIRGELEEKSWGDTGKSIIQHLREMPTKEKMQLGNNPSLLTEIALKEPRIKNLLGSVRSIITGSEGGGEGLKSLLQKPEIQSMFSSQSAEGAVGASEGSAVAEGAELAEIAETVENLELLASLA